MGCRLSKDETLDTQQQKTNEMFRDNDKIDYKSRYERKMCLAKETPEPDFDLSDCNLKEVPSGVFVLCRVLRKEILNLSNNKLIAFDGGDYGELTLIQILNLNYNRIKKLPDEIFKLENLRELNISNNLLVKLPRTINSLKYLEMLDISFNDIKTIDEINCMPRLKILNLSGNRRLKTLPDTLATCDNLYDLVVDADTIEWPPLDVVNGGTRSIIKFLTTGEVTSPSYDDNNDDEDTTNENINKDIDIAQDALTLNTHNNKNNEVNMEENSKKYTTEFKDTYGNEDALLHDLHLRQMKQKREFLNMVLQKQNETESLVYKIQQQKDNERSKLIKDILAAEENANIVIEQLLALKTSPDTLLLEQERLEVERLLEKVHLEHSELRKQEILSTMIEVLQSEESKINYYQQWRDASSKSVLARENETLKQLSKIFIDYEVNRANIIERICDNEELQKQAVAALIAKNDARTWGLVEQLKIVEAQLANMTQLEIERKKYSTSEQVNELADKRIRLTNILMDLLQQRENRKQELLDTLLSIEAQKHNEEDFWLLQYQCLLDSRPLEFTLKTTTIDPFLGYNFLVNGVIHCLPFLQKLWQKDGFCLELVTNEDLEAAGIRDRRDRSLILKSIEEFIKESNSDDVEQRRQEREATAPPLTPSSSSPEKLATIDDGEASNSVPIERRKQFTMAESASECIICMEETVKIIFVPCGHMCCCLNCQKKVDLCPLCRAIIERKIKVIQP